MTTLSPYAAHARAAEPVPALSKVGSVTPSVGFEVGGERLIVKGGGFTGATRVTFGATQAAAFAVTSATAITVITPQLKAGTYRVAVTTVAGTSTSTGTFTVRTLEAEMLRLVNVARSSARKCGGTKYKAVSPVHLDSRLAKAAAVHSKDMAVHNFFSHYGSNGASPFTRIKRAGYQYDWVGENLAAGFFSPASAMQGLLNSSHHCAIIMTGKYQELGIGIARGGKYGMYWTQDFGNPR